MFKCKGKYIPIYATDRKSLRNYLNSIYMNSHYTNKKIHVCLIALV